MLRSMDKDSDQSGLVNEWLPKAYFSLPDEPRKADDLLSDKRFPGPLAEHFSRNCGMPGTPIDVYLRMTYLEPVFCSKSGF